MPLRCALWSILWIQILISFLIFHRFYLYQDQGQLVPAFLFSTGKKTRISHLERLSNYDKSILKILDKLIARRASSRDPESIRLIRKLLDPPAPVAHPVKLSRDVYKTPQAIAIDAYLDGMTGGFFVEVGGYDGERSSNSIYFELEKNWKGVLVEADPFFYTQLLGKNRRCWSLNACLSPHKYLSKLGFNGSSAGQGRIILENENDPNQNSAKGRHIDLFSENMVVPCFPLETILLALKQTRIDFLSLDVEGVELEILKTIDFDRVDIRTLAVEFMHGNKTEYKSYMKARGYEVYGEIVVSDPVNFLYAGDFIFVKKVNKTTSRRRKMKHYLK